MTVNQRIRDFIGEAMRSRIQAADTDKVVNQTVDPRFDFEAVPLNPQEDIYSSEYKDLETGEPRRVTNAFGPVTASIASAGTGIDPMFLSTSTLVLFLTNLPQVKSAEQAMNTIGIKEEGNWFKPSKSEKAVTDRVREAVDSGVAEFLQQKKNQGQPVTRDEISGLFYDHLGRFQTKPRYGQETQHKDNYKFSMTEDHTINLLDLALKQTLSYGLYMMLDYQLGKLKRVALITIECLMLPQPPW